MLKDLIARNKAAEALGIAIDGRRHWLSDGWPETIPIKTLAKWQYPDDAASQDALIRAVKALVASGRLPKRYVEPNYFAADAPPLSPRDVADWLKRQNIEPREHIKAWIAAAQSAAEPKPEAVDIDSNDITGSGLLNEPRRKDDWFQVIDDMTAAFHKDFGTIPNEVQAWGRLCTNPPAGYEITTGTDKGEDCLKMLGFSPLSRTAFAKRWAKYSANNGQ